MHKRLANPVVRLWLNKKNEDPVSQLISENLHLVLARHDHHQRRAVCGGGADASDTDAAIVAGSRASWPKRAEGG